MKKTKLLIFMLGFFLVFSTNAQEKFTVQIEPLTINKAPNVHSFSWGKTSDGKWLIIGGRIDGLHQRQANSSFPESNNNKDVYVIGPNNNQVWNTSLSTLPASIYEQLQSTNQEFYQRGNILYIIGGYGYSATQNDHVTFPYLTAVNVDGLANAVINNSGIVPYFRQITDTNFAVTGGQLGFLDNMFYLCGGQYFKGRYNPMGPNSGAGFIQKYTNEIRKFEIVDDGTTITLNNYTAYNDTNNLHRRDYNMSPQIFPNGVHGFTMFSGVFQYIANIPWLNSVDITNTGYTVNNDFTQYLSQYHSAKMPVYDAANNTMHTIFFGGMSQYTLDSDNNLVQDDNVPFVKTISKVTRFNDGSMIESKLDVEMPGLLGSGAEFIPITDDNLFIDNEIINLNKLPQENILVGYIYGGIESSQDNIFFINDGTQSSASNQIFKVYINKSVLGIGEIAIEGDNIYNIEVYPNPSKDIFSVVFFIPNTNRSFLEVFDMSGLQIRNIEINKPIGRHTINLDLSDVPSGGYILSIKSNNYISKKKILKH
ncbi:MAG: T9SS type A sorting domain-containing protein [Chlorobi bacterium]|nr:T9SS type A sorting domain-containing protein [Chlorobiota bacterium]